MNFVQEYALLIAVASPVAVIVGIQVWLHMNGERGTLLLPSLLPFPSIKLEAAASHSREATLAKIERLVAVERRTPVERRAPVHADLEKMVA